MSRRLLMLTGFLFALTSVGAVASAEDQFNENRLLAAISAVESTCPDDYSAAFSSGVHAMNVFAHRSGATHGVVPMYAPEGFVGVYTSFVRSTPNIDRDALAASGLGAVSAALSDECRAALPSEEMLEQ